MSALQQSITTLPPSSIRRRQIKRLHESPIPCKPPACLAFVNQSDSAAFFHSVRSTLRPNRSNGDVIVRRLYAPRTETVRSQNSTGRASSSSNSPAGTHDSSAVVQNSSVGRSSYSASVTSAETRATTTPAPRSTQHLHSSLRKRRNPNMIEFSANLQTDLPLRQHPQATFDDYLHHSERVFWAFFPERNRCSKIGKHTWRIYMLPLEFFLLSVKPVIDMDILLDPRPNRVQYPGGKTVIHLISRNWELRGVEYKKSEFDLSLQGSLYAVQKSPSAPSSSSLSTSSHSFSHSHSHSSSTSSSTSLSSHSSSRSQSPRTAPSEGAQKNSLSPGGHPRVVTQNVGTGREGALLPSALKGSMSISVALVAPGVLAALPTDTISSVGSAVLSRLLGAMKDKVNTRVLEDYKLFVLQKTGERV